MHDKGNSNQRINKRRRARVGQVVRGISIKIKINGEEKQLSKMVYQDDIALRKLMRSLRIYNMKAYKQFIFAETLKLEPIENNEYAINLDTDDKFKVIYGQVRIIAKLKDDVLIIKTIEPQDFLEEGHKRLLKTYKGVPIIGEREIHKANILERLGKFWDERR